MQCRWTILLIALCSTPWLASQASAQVPEHIQAQPPSPPTIEFAFPYRENRATVERSWRETTQFAEIRNALDRAQYAKATQLLNRIIQTPDRRRDLQDALKVQAQISISNGNYEQARFLLTSALAQPRQAELTQDDSTDILYAIALTYLAQPTSLGTIEARKILADYARRFENSRSGPQAFYLLGALYQDAGQYAQAIDVYERYVLHSQTDLSRSAAVRLAYCHLQLGDTQAARQLPLNSDQQPSGTIAHAIATEDDFIEAAVHASLGNIQDALWIYEQISRRPERGFKRAALLGIAQTYGRAGQTDSATTYYHKILADSARDRIRDRAEYLLTVDHLRRGASPEAVTTLNRIKAEGGNAMQDYARLTLAQTAWNNRNYGECADLLASPTTTPSLCRRTRLMRGAALLADGKLSTAIPVLDSVANVCGAAPRSNPSDYASANRNSQMLGAAARVSTGRQAEAVPTLNRLIEANPNTAVADEARYWLGEAYLRTGLTAFAAQTFDDLLNRKAIVDHVADALYALGWARLQNREYAEAINAFTTLVKAYPASRYISSARLRLGDAYYMAGQYADALNTYGQIKINDTSADAVEHADFQIALTNYRTNQFSEGLTRFAQFINNHTSARTITDARLLAARCAMGTSNTDAATTYANEVLADTNRRLAQRSLCLLGDAYQADGNTVLAYAAFAIAQDSFPNSTHSDEATTAIARLESTDNDEVAATKNSDDRLNLQERAQYYRGDIFLNAGDSKRALVEYTASSTQSPVTPGAVHAYLGKARAQLAQLHIDDALQTLTDVTAAIGDRELEAQPLLEIATTFVDAGQREQSDRWFAILAQRYPESSENIRAVVVHSQSDIRRGDTSAALARLRSTADANDSTPEMTQLILQLASIEQVAGELDSARLRLAQIAPFIARLDNEALEDYGDLQHTLRNYSGAVAAYELLIARPRFKPNNRNQALLKLGGSYEMTSQTERAKDIYRELIRTHINDEYAKKAMARLEALSAL